MKKIHRISLLILIFIILSTYSLKNSNINIVEKSDFFKINKVIIANNLLIKKKIIINRLNYL
jgi:hypothetical protein